MPPKKITRGTGGYLVADSGNNRLVLLANDLEAIESDFPLNKPPLVAISFQNSDDNYYVSYIDTNSLSKFSADADVRGQRPIDITKAFVEALLNKDRATMDPLTFNPKIVNGIFMDVDAWVDFFEDNDIKSYNTYSNDGFISGVEILFNNTTNRFFVNLIKYKNTWYIKSF